MKRAFTLIELLVVIAIIAILAAILFPVFAQAKEAAKKTADLSNVKQLATGTAVYTADVDDMFPLQAGMDLSGTWGYNFNKYAPARWSANPANANRPYYSDGFALNTMQPYLKNTEMLSMPGANKTAYNATETLAAGQQKATTNYAYNGYLSGYSGTAIAESTKLPVFTGANGKDAGIGWGFANPALTCATPNVACTYIPASSTGCATGNGSTGAIYTTWNGSSYWAYSRGQNWAFADGHAKFRRVGAAATSDYRTDPWTGYDTNTGKAGSYWWNGCHAWLFRPDYDFSL